MRSSAIVMACLLVTGLAIPALGRDSEPTQAELDRLEEVRRMIKENGYAWEAGITSVSHLTDEEFQKLLGARIPPDYDERFERARAEGRVIQAAPGATFETRFDWSEHDGVTSVKNPGSCGSCWAMAGAGALESQVLIYSGLTEDLSEQAVLSCVSWGWGCSGGFSTDAYDYWITHGAVRESCMCYHEVDTDLCADQTCEIAAVLDDYYYVEPDNPSLKTAILSGPVACYMTVTDVFKFYGGGCFWADSVCFGGGHMVLLVGWDDCMCDTNGAWIIKNSWGLDWGDCGYAYVQYGSCSIGHMAHALIYTPPQTVHFYHDSHNVIDTAGDGDGFIEIGEPITLPVTLLNIGVETATNVNAALTTSTPGVLLFDSLAAYPDIPKNETRQSTAPHFKFVVSGQGPPCGKLEFHLVVTSDQGASDIDIAIQAGEIVSVFKDNFETQKLWYVNPRAIRGNWERCDPNATWWGLPECGYTVQVEEGYSLASGNMCYVTQQAYPGEHRTEHDVDCGWTDLITRRLNLLDKDSAVLTYARWFTNNTGDSPNHDCFTVDVSDDNGQTWYNLDIQCCDDRRWREMRFFLEDYVALTDSMWIRFTAEDYHPESIVEAALDDVAIVGCSWTPHDSIPPNVEVVAPNGGEVLTPGSEYEIEWEAYDAVGVTSITILLSDDGGLTFPHTVATDEPDDSSYMWTVPATPCETARIKVVAWDAAYNAGWDISDEDFTIQGVGSGIEVDDAPTPEQIVLEVTGGNPITPTSKITFGIPTGSQVRLDVYDVTGRLVNTLAAGYRGQGYYTIEWDGFDRTGARLSPGLYFVRLDCGHTQKTAKAVITQ